MSVEQLSSTGQETAPEGQVSAEKRPRLLLIQHDPGARITLWDKFKNAGFEVDIAASTYLAINKVRTSAPDAIFIDLAPANTKTLAIIKEARREKSFGGRPIYVCTTPALMAANRRATTAATKVFDKGATAVDEIVTELAKAVAQRQSEEAAQAQAKAAAQPAKKAGTSGFSLNPARWLGFGPKKERPAPIAAGAPAAQRLPQAAAPAPSLEVPAPAGHAAAPAGKTDQARGEAPRPQSPTPPAHGTPARPQRLSRHAVGVFTVDGAGKIVSADAAAANLFGWQAADLLGRGLSVLVKEGSEVELRKIIELAGDSPQQLFSVQVTARRKDGGEFPASITRLAWSSDTVAASRLGHCQQTWTAVFRDLSVAVGPAPRPMAPRPQASAATADTAPPARGLDELAESKETQEMLRGANRSLQKQLEIMAAKVAASAEAAHDAGQQRDALKARVETLEKEFARAASCARSGAQPAPSSGNTQIRHLLTEKFELEQQLEEHRRAQQQGQQDSAELNAARAAAERADAVCRQEAARARALEEEISGLRQRLEALEGQLRESSAELERIKAQEARKEHNQSTLEASLQKQLNEAKTATEQAEERAQRLADELAALRQERDELNSRVGSETEDAAEIQRRNRELETQLQEALARLQQQAQPDAAKESSAKEQPRGRKAAGSDTAQWKRLEREVANLREERHELHAKCVAEKQAGTKAKRRIRELEKQLREIASGFNTAKRELEKRAADRGQMEVDRQGELDVAKAGIEEVQAARDEQTVRANLLEQELGQVCQARDELRAELEAEKHKVLTFGQRVDELEGRLRGSAAELARARAASEHHVAVAASQQPGADSSLTEGTLKELFRLRENEAAHAAEVSELERRVRDSVGALAHVSADLESERTERRRVEQRLSALTTQLEHMHLDLKQQLESERGSQGRVNELEQQLRERERMLGRLRADLQKETANRDLAEQQLKAVGDMSAQLRQYLSLFEDSKKVFKRTQEQLEAKLRASHEALGEAEAKLQKEISERRSLKDQYEQKVLELAHVQSDLQVEQLERKGLEGDAHQSRYASLDSARAAQTMLNNLRRQLHEAVDTLMQTTRHLLEISPEGEQKKLVQTALESVLVLQSTLDESLPPATGPGQDPELRSAA